MTSVYAWHAPWLAAFGTPPPRPSSREESAQQVLSNIFLGLSPADFLKYQPTPDGEAVLRALWEAAFGDAPSVSLDWLVSEYELPVPKEWQEEIGLSYRAPDFVCGAGDRILVVELKTEWGSYKAAQITDFLRLARRLHPDARIDLLLLEERLRGSSRELDSRQRYAEMTWHQLAGLLRTQLPGHDLAARLCEFIDASLPGITSPAATEVTTEVTTEEWAALSDRVTTAIDQALHLAPAIEADPRNKNLARGIDVPFATEADAREAEAAIREALTHAGHDRVTTWLWRSTTTDGIAATPAGRDTGIELRVQPRS